MSVPPPNLKALAATGASSNGYRVRVPLSGVNSSDDTPLTHRLERFMQRQFPQIAMHGGSAGIERIDEETGEVWLTLGGACSGCGISPMTVQALETRMIQEFAEVSVVHADTADAHGRTERPDLSDVPF